MSYYMLDGIQAAQVAAQTRALQGYGLGYYGGFGAIDFNADAVWSDWLAGASGDNAAGMRAANSIRAALAQLGFGTSQINAAWGTGTDKSAYSSFASQQGIPAPSGMPSWWPSKAGVIKLGELIQSGETPGTQPVTEFHQAGGQFIPGPAPGKAPIAARAPSGGAATTGVTKAGLSTGAMIGLGALALVAVGGIALLAKKKRAPASHPTAPPPSHVTVTETIPRPHAKPIRETVHVR